MTAISSGAKEPFAISLKIATTSPGAPWCTASIAIAAEILVGPVPNRGTIIHRNRGAPRLIDVVEPQAIRRAGRNDKLPRS